MGLAKREMQYARERRYFSLAVPTDLDDVDFMLAKTLGYFIGVPHYFPHNQINTSIKAGSTSSRFSVLLSSFHGLDVSIKNEILNQRTILYRIT